jgi:peroxiredoxin
MSGTSFSSDSVIGLTAGSLSPISHLNSIEGEKLSLLEKDKNYILVFYRGSWCPICMVQLKSVQAEVNSKLDSSSRVIAISVDKLKTARKMKRKFGLTFDVVSNPKADLLAKFKIINKLDEQLVLKYKNSYKIDVEGDSGEKHHLVAHPAVFIIKNKKIIYADAHINYKERTKNSEILGIINSESNSL